MSLSIPGNALAKITPVRFAKGSGKAQRSGSCRPVEVFRYFRTRGNPASRNASTPAAMARRLAVSRASTKPLSRP